MAMSEKTRIVLEFLKNNAGRDLTAADIAAELEMTVPSVNGVVTAGLQNKELAYRDEVELTDAEGNVSKVKYIRLTPEGMSFVAPEAPAAE